MKKNTITIHDIALALNVADSTVSRALNNNKRISRKTREMVIAKAKELGYGQIQYGDTAIKTIGLIVPELSNPVYLQAIKIIEDYAYKMGYSVIAGYSKNSEEKEDFLLQNFAKLNVTGIIISQVNENSSIPILSQFIEKNIPVINFINVNNSLNNTKLVIDIYQGAYSAVQHLINLSFTRIAVLLNENDNTFNNDLLKGYFQALRDNFVQTDMELIYRNHLKEQEIRRTLSAIFRADKKIHALILPNQQTTIMVLNFLKENNIRCPKDIAIINFSDDNNTNYILPTISSVRFSAKHIGMSVIRQFFKELETSDTKKRKKLIIEPTKFIIGNTSI